MNTTTRIDCGQGLVCGFNNVGEFYARQGNGVYDGSSAIRVGGDAAKTMAMAILKQYSNQLGNGGDDVTELRAQLDLTIAHNQAQSKKLRELEVEREAAVARGIAHAERGDNLMVKVAELTKLIGSAADLEREVKELRDYRDLREQVESVALMDSSVAVTAGEEW